MIEKSTILNIQHRLLSGSLWVAGAMLINALTGLGNNAILARLLEPKALGAFFLAFSAVSVAAMLGQLGMNRVLVRLISEAMAQSNWAKACRVVKTSLILAVSATVVVAGIFVTGAGEYLSTEVFKSPHLLAVVPFISVWIILATFQGLIPEIFRGFHDLRNASIFSGMTGGLILFSSLAGILVVVGHASLVTVLALVLIASTLSVGISGFLLRRKMLDLPDARGFAVAAVLSPALVLLSSGLLLQAMREAPLWLLGAVGDPADVAMLGVVLRLITLITMPLLLVNMATQSTMAHLNARGETQKLNTLLRGTAGGMLLVVAPVLLVIVVFGKSLLGLIFGQYYTGGYVALVIISIAHGVNVFTGSAGILLLMTGHERVQLSVVSVSLILSIGTCILLIPRYGVIGAALGAATGIILQNVVMWWYCYRYLNMRTDPGYTEFHQLWLKFRRQIMLRANDEKVFFVLERVVRFMEASIWRTRRLKVIECVGDSHVSSMVELAGSPELTSYRFQVMSVRGATMFGLANPRSKTNALNVFRYWLKGASSDRPVLLMLGEVDMGFLIWVRAEQNNLSVEECIDDALTRYKAFIKELQEQGRNVIVCSVPLPTIPDDDAVGQIAHARSQVRATQDQRTSATLRFNKCLSEWCAEVGAYYIDMDPFSLDKETGLVMSSLRNKNPANHHYDEAEFCKIFSQAFLLNESVFDGVFGVVTDR